MNPFTKECSPHEVLELMGWLRVNFSERFEAWIKYEDSTVRKIEAKDRPIHIRLMMFGNEKRTLIVQFDSDEDAALCKLKWAGTL